MCGTPDKIEREQFDKLMSDLIDSDTKSRAKIKGLDDQRKDQIVAGALLIGEIFERLQIKRITLCPAALREGVLLEYLNRHSPELEIRRDIAEVLVGVRIPDAGEIGAAVLRSRRRRREVGLAFRVERYRARYVFPPLRMRGLRQSRDAEQQRE